MSNHTLHVVFVKSPISEVSNGANTYEYKSVLLHPVQNGTVVVILTGDSEAVRFGVVMPENRAKDGVSNGTVIGVVDCSAHRHAVESIRRKKRLAAYMDEAVRVMEKENKWAVAAATDPAVSMALQEYRDICAHNRTLQVHDDQYAEYV